MSGTSGDAVPAARREPRPPAEVDVLVVGTGPVGAAVAAVLARLRPRARVLLIDAGTAVTDPPGTSLRALPPAERARVDAAAVDDLSAGMEGQATRSEGLASVGLRTCVGGMASLWSGAVPRPRRWAG